MRYSAWNMIAAALLVAPWVARVAVADERSAVTPVEIDLRTQLSTIPDTPDALRGRLDLVRQQIDRLRPATQPTTQPVDDDTAARQAARQALFKDWQIHQDRLEQLQRLRQAVADLSGQVHIQSVTTSLARIDAETAAIGTRAPPSMVTEAEEAAFRRQVQDVEARVAELAEANSRRAARLAGGFQTERAAAEAELEKLRQQRQALKAQLESVAQPTTAPAGITARQIELQRLDVQTATAELAEPILAAEQHLAELQLRQDERLLAALRRQLEVGRRRLATLVQVRTRDRLDVLRTHRAASTDPAEIGLFDLKIFTEQVRLQYFQEDFRGRGPGARPPEEAARLLQDRLAVSRAYWDRTVAVLEYRSGDEAYDLQQQLQDESGQLGADLAELRDRLGTTLDRLQQLQTVRDRAIQRVERLVEALAAAARGQETARRTSLDAEAASVRAAADEAMRAVIRQAEGTAARLDTAVGSLEEHLAILRGVDRRLHWKRLSSRDSGLLGAQWAAAWTELVQMVRGRPPAVVGEADVEAAAELDRQLFGQRSDAHTEIRRALSALRDQLGSATRRDWLWTVAVTGLCVALGLSINRLVRRRGHRLAREIVERDARSEVAEQTVGRGLSSRLDLLILNLVADLALPLLIGAATWLTIVRLIPDEVVGKVLLTWLALVIGAITLWRVVHHLFEADRPMHRPIRCGDQVARHYRAWLNGLVLWSLVLLPFVLALRLAEVAPALETVLLEIFKTGFLLLLVLFLLRKQRLLGAAVVGPLHWAVVLTWVVYPLGVLLVMALLTMQIVGYGALVTYIGFSLLQSIGVLIVGLTVAGYVADLLDRYVMPDMGRSSPAAGRGHSGADGSEDEEQVGRTHYVLALLKWFLRLLVVAGAVLVVLRIWNVDLEAAWVTPRVVGLSTLVILVTLLVDRIVFTALFTLQRTGRLPASTANFLRRWVRGVLVVVVILSLVAIAGLRIDSLWTFLTGLLAMVAIGFVAVWSMLSNILATIVILIWRPFNVGERIAILPDGLEGQVVDINFMYTVLEPAPGRKMSVPNNFFVQKFIQRQLVRGVPERTLAEQLEAEKPLNE